MQALKKHKPLRPLLCSVTFAYPAPNRPKGAQTLHKRLVSTHFPSPHNIRRMLLVLCGLLAGTALYATPCQAEANPDPYREPDVYCLLVLRHYKTLLSNLANKRKQSPNAPTHRDEKHLTAIFQKNPSCFSYSIGQDLLQIRDLLLQRTPQKKASAPTPSFRNEPPFRRFRLWWSVETGPLSAAYDPSAQGGGQGTVPVAISAWGVGGRVGFQAYGFFLTGDLMFGFGDAHYGQTPFYQFTQLDTWMIKVSATAGGFLGSFMLSVGVGLLYTQMHDQRTQLEALYVPLELGLGMRIPFGDYALDLRVIASMAFDSDEKKGTYTAAQFVVSFGAR